MTFPVFPTGTTPLFNVTVSWWRTLARCCCAGCRIGYRRAQSVHARPRYTIPPRRLRCVDAAPVTIERLALPGWRVAAHAQREWQCRFNVGFEMPPTLPGRPIGCDVTDDVDGAWRCYDVDWHRTLAEVDPSGLVGDVYRGAYRRCASSIRTSWSTFLRPHGWRRRQSRRYVRRLRHWQPC